MKKPDADIYIYTSDTDMSLYWHSLIVYQDKQKRIFGLKVDFDTESVFKGLTNTTHTGDKLLDKSVILYTGQQANKSHTALWKLQHNIRLVLLLSYKTVVYKNTPM